jgi:hypothetical protein
MRNEPNFQKSQMLVTAISTMNYSEKMKLDTWSKRTQTKPILPAIAGKIALSAVEEPVAIDLEIRSLRFGRDDASRQ